jgi:hypothetical protein
LLKKVEKKIGNNKTTYSTDLDKLCKHYFNDMFVGCYPSDQIPILSKERCYCIVNLDSSNQSGSHWVSLAYKHNKYIFYDSFGRSQNEILKSLNNRQVIQTENDAEQTVTESNCGQRSCAFLLFLHMYGVNDALKL